MFQGRVRVVLAVFAQKADGVVQADQAVALADRVQLLVGQVARNRAKRMGVGVGGDQRGVCVFLNVPKALLVQMGEVDQDAKPIAGLDQG